MKKLIDRRKFLRCSAGGVGTVVGLPLLEAMFASSSAFADAPGLHPRFFGFYTPNGTIEPQWFPKGGSKTNFDLKNTALEPFQTAGLVNSISLYQGLFNTGKNGSGNGHMRAIAGFLTGAKLPNDDITRHKVSLDQALANEYFNTAPTKIHSLQLAGNPELDVPKANSSYNNLLKNALSFDVQGRILPNTANLKEVFDKLFLGSSGSQATAGISQRDVLKTSVLDAVKEEREALFKKLSAHDSSILDEYFTSIRSLENQLAAPEPTMPGGQSCQAPNVNPPALDDGKRNNAIGDHARIAAKIVAMAFQCDLTRSVTYMAGGEAAGCNYNDIGIGRHFHNSISHNRSSLGDEHHQIDTFHSELAANFMLEMEAINHGGGTLLDGTAIIYGAGLGNGDNHSLNDISLLVGGRFGDFQHGRHHVLKGENHAKLINTVYQEMNLPGTIGDSTARVPIS